MKPHGGLYCSHHRNYFENLEAAIDEALTIGREAKLPVHISHLKASGKKAWGKAADAVALIDHHIVRDAGVVELDRSANTGKPGTDHDDLVVGS